MLSVSTQLTGSDSLTLFETMLKSISFADEIIIFALDRHDQDLQSLATKYHAKVINLPTPQIVELIRDQEVKTAKHDWVLVIDGDEVVTTALQQEIASVITNESIPAYSIPRRNFSLGYPIRRGGFGDDYVVRLIHKPSFQSWPTNIHSTPVVTGTTGKLCSFLEHHKDEGVEQMVDKTNRYSEIESQQFLDGHLPQVTPITLIRKWWMESFRRGILKGGLLDGRIGIIQSLYQGYSVFTSYAKLYEKQRGAK